MDVDNDEWNGRNKRQNPRVSFDRPIIVTHKSGKSVKARSINVSMGGLLMRQNFLQFKIGDQVFLEIVDEKSFGEGHIPAQVVHTKKVDRFGEKFFLVGVKFTRLTKMSTEKLNEMLQVLTGEVEL